MTGNFIDNIRFNWKQHPPLDDGYFYLDTDFGKIRVFDSMGYHPVIINVPDGPNVIEHQLPLLRELSKRFRVICFEYPGLGLSYPSNKFDYSFDSGSALLVQLMHALNVSRASLLFSCSNGFYAMQAASKYPELFNHIFLSQTPSTRAMLNWTKKSIPMFLKVPVIGQITNALLAKKFAGLWYNYALPKNHPEHGDFVQTATHSLDNGGCFCLSSLVFGLKKDAETLISVSQVPITLIWGAKDFTHRKTDKESIREHIEDCEIIEFGDCGHFPELENVKDYVKLINERIS